MHIVTSLPPEVGGIVPLPASRESYHLLTYLDCLKKKEERSKEIWGHTLADVHYYNNGTLLRLPEEADASTGHTTAGGVCMF
jgi:hypothetical protein